MTDKWQAVRDAQHKLESALHDLIQATAQVGDQPPNAMKIVGFSDWVLTTRVKAVDSDGDMLGFPQTFSPIGQEECVGEMLAKESVKWFVDECVYEIPDEDD